MFAMLGLGAPEIALIVGIGVLLLGPTQLPRLAKGVGETMRILRSAGKDLEKEMLSDGEEKE